MDQAATTSVANPSVPATGEHPRDQGSHSHCTSFYNKKTMGRFLKLGPHYQNRLLVQAVYQQLQIVNWTKKQNLLSTNRGNKYHEEPSLLIGANGTLSRSFQSSQNRHASSERALFCKNTKSPQITQDYCFTPPESEILRTQGNHES